MSNKLNEEKKLKQDRINKMNNLISNVVGYRKSDKYKNLNLSLTLFIFVFLTFASSKFGITLLNSMFLGGMVSVPFLGSAFALRHHRDKLLDVYNKNRDDLDPLDINDFDVESYCHERDKLYEDCLKLDDKIVKKQDDLSNNDNDNSKQDIKCLAVEIKDYTDFKGKVLVKKK